MFMIGRAHRRALTHMCGHVHHRAHPSHDSRAAHRRRHRHRSRVVYRESIYIVRTLKTGYWLKTIIATIEANNYNKQQ